MLIALTGPPGSGKSAIAKALVEEHGFACVELDDLASSMARVDGFLDQHRDVVVDGCRLPVEARAIYQRGGRVAFVHRQGADYTRARPLPATWISIFVTNNGTPELVANTLANRKSTP